MELQDESTDPHLSNQPTQAVDFYETLGLPRSATEKQIGTAYKNLALKYHPDRNPDNEEAARVYKAVTEAYAVLSDVNKRRQYDQGGVTAVTAAESENIDMTSLNGLGRVFGAVIARLGVPVPTQVSAEFLEVGSAICRSGTLEGSGTPELSARVNELVWGFPFEARLDRQQGQFYRFAVTDVHVENGFSVSVKSANKDKFKILLFGPDGSVLFQEDSVLSRDKRSTQASLYFTLFETYKFSEQTPQPAAAAGAGGAASTAQSAQSVQTSDSAVSAVFTKLDPLMPSRKQILPGRYLLGVYGDNFMSKSVVTCLVVPSLNDSQQVTNILSSDSSLVEARGRLQTLHEEYKQTKAAYEASLTKISEINSEIEVLLDQRDQAYKGYWRESAIASAPAHIVVAKEPIVASVPGEASNESTPSIGGPSSVFTHSDDGHPRRLSLVDNLSIEASNLSTTAKVSLDSAVQAAATARTTAASHATAASGWLSRNLTSQISRFQTAVAQVRRPSTTAPVEVDGTAAATTTDPAQEKEMSFHAVIPAAEDSNESKTDSEATATDIPLQDGSQTVV